MVNTNDGSVAVAKAELFKALGHPIRIRILELLVDGEHSVGDLAAELDVEMTRLSQQLAVLRRARVVTSRRFQKTVYYSFRDPRMSQLLAVAKQMLLTGLRENHAMIAELEAEMAAASARPSPS
jgi:DNA-binding transcriptional ArsR family regulator